MSKVIRNDTIVTADRSWKADVEVQQGKVVAIGREPRAAVNRARPDWKEIVAPRKVLRSGIPATGA